MQVTVVLGVDKATSRDCMSPQRHRFSLSVCSCLPFSIFSPAGARCEQLAISLAAFLGILVGALVLLCLLLTTACLASHLCRRQHHWNRG